MGKKSRVENKTKAKGPGITSLLVPYKTKIFLLIFFALLSNGINLALPQIIARGIDSYPDHYNLSRILISYLLAAIVIFIFTYVQSIMQTNTSEEVARDIRSKLAAKISTQSHAYIEETNPSKLLTNITADVDSVKLFVSQAVVTIASSLVIIIGASIMLFLINWKLALAIVAIIPIIGGAFFYVSSKIRPIFIKGREVIDRLNKVINESILGSALVRVINAQQPEYEKFLNANEQSKNLGLSILRMFAWLIPIIVFTATLAGITILALGGHFVINDTMTLGEFAAFNSYLSLLIFPIILIGFMSNVIAQSTASYQRISGVLQLHELKEGGSIKTALQGNVALKNVSVLYGQKPILKDISFKVDAGSSLAIIGPTAAGKTQLLYLLTGLIEPTEGTVEFDGERIDRYNKENFYNHVGFVFQDSIVFNMSLRENIAFSNVVTEAALDKAIAAAELKDFIDSLPGRLDTIVSERGTNLSGGQKQRIMLARALAINPKILLLDDFTSRVDAYTEQKILYNVKQAYPDITLISVTQKISSAEHFDKIIVLMEGELLAAGTHQELLATSTEYVQIYQSQQSMSNYELQPQ